jgi:hypothetical protein
MWGLSGEFCDSTCVGREPQLGASAQRMAEDSALGLSLCRRAGAVQGRHCPCPDLRPARTSQGECVVECLHTRATLTDRDARTQQWPGAAFMPVIPSRVAGPRSPANGSGFQERPRPSGQPHFVRHAERPGASSWPRPLCPGPFTPLGLGAATYGFAYDGTLERDAIGGGGNL